ncbi:MAG: hypothetical protein Q7T86_13890 [Hyphomicrobiaceae bacterium]|nr:hypothetical protein [Hyphomicrobiaceae bacterium]
MDCGDGLGCQILTVLTENDFTARVLLKWIADPTFGWVSKFLDAHGEKLIGLAGVAFGLVRWWRYRETILHQRFSKYMLESDTRLFGAQTYALQGIQRPGPGEAVAIPLFVEESLCSVFREKRWAHPVFRGNVLGSAEKQLAEGAALIQERLQIAEAGLSSLRHQLATTHLLRGAIKSASAYDEPHRASNANHAALTSFKTALQVPGEDRNPIAKELEAHQLRKLDQLPAALACYRQAEEFANALPDHQDKQLSIARAKRYQAEIIQALASTTLPSGQREFLGSRSAYKLLCGDGQNNALALRSPFGPYRDWELLEQGDTHYLAALVSKNLRYVEVLSQQLSDAKSSYQAVIDQSIPHWSNQLLRDRAHTGLARLAKARSGEFEIDWICHP